MLLDALETFKDASSSKKKKSKRIRFCSFSTNLLASESAECFASLMPHYGFHPLVFEYPDEHRNR